MTDLPTNFARANMDTMYAKMLKVFEDGKLHTYKDVVDLVYKPLGRPEYSGRMSFKRMDNLGYIKNVDSLGENRSWRYQITDLGRTVLKVAEENQKVFKFLRHFKEKDKDNYFSAILKKSVAGDDSALGDLTPKVFIEALDALCKSKDPDIARLLNYEVYRQRLKELVEKSDAIDDIACSPEVIGHCYKMIGEAEHWMERGKWYDWYSFLKDASKTKKKAAAAKPINPDDFV